MIMMIAGVYPPLSNVSALPGQTRIFGKYIKVLCYRMNGDENDGRGGSVTTRGQPSICSNHHPPPPPLPKRPGAHSREK